MVITMLEMMIKIMKMIVILITIVLLTMIYSFNFILGLLIINKPFSDIL